MVTNDDRFCVDVPHHVIQLIISIQKTNRLVNETVDKTNIVRGETTRVAIASATKK
jgi:hypothetical protein